jgi:hypothetical protein
MHDTKTSLVWEVEGNEKIDEIFVNESVTYF